jgi:hypothetical protein
MLKHLAMNKDVTFAINPEFVRKPLDILKLELILLDLDPRANLNDSDLERLFKKFYFLN